ncbi:F-box only 6-like protein [Labeo rohita]|uniref:F-box only 6-like protein n=1 Tax=Labeo rohita TaxID=84645 RepID=A0A498LTL4_LABRO|nr:F-box only 6-like protein [Labeo rohita]
MVLRVGLCLKMDPETPSATEPAETPSATEPVVRPRPPRERHLPAHLTDYEVQLPPNLHPEPPPADSVSQRPSRPSRHASNSISSGTVSSTSSRSHRSVQRRSPRHGLSVLQAAMLEERLKTLELEELEQQIEEDAIFDKECERLDAQAREAQYRQEQATKARELLAKQESRDVNVPASQSSLAVDALSECSGQQSAIPLLMVEEILMYLPAHEVVQVCRLVCHEWKELVDSAAHWRERCKREEIQPYDASRVPEDWRLFYFQSKYRKNLLKNPKADDGLQEWEFEHNTGDRWVTGEIGKPFPDNTVTKCFVASRLRCTKSNLLKNPSAQGDSYNKDYTVSATIMKFCVRLRCTKSNLLKNPSAQDGLRGWKIVPSGGDCWVIKENSKPIPDTVTRYFVTSYGLCLKQQLIDLNEEGYSDSFMDEVQPHIKISDWCVPCNVCGSEYQICVELLDERKKTISTFQPEKVMFPFCSGEPWCQMTHVFKNYGPGVRFVRFTHGGQDTQYWAGHYGVRITNSSVEICPADESFRFTNRNLLKNPSAQEGFQGWELVENGGDGWVTQRIGRTFPVSTCFVTSCGYAPFSDCGSEYQICVELLDEKKKPISTFQPEKVFFQKGKMYPWRQMTHVFMNYGPGVRFIRFTHADPLLGSIDSQYLTNRAEHNRMAKQIRHRL